MKDASGAAPDREHLVEVRIQLERLDAELLEALARRHHLVRELWSWKREQGLPLRDADRETELLARADERGATLGLPRAATRRFMTAVLDSMHEPPLPEDPSDASARDRT
jgi:chorismate mutase